MKKVIFIPLAMNQSQFYLGVAQALKSKGIESEFISMHERSCELFRKNGFKVFNYFEYERHLDPSKEADFDKYNIRNLHYWMGHEREAYWIFDWKKLHTKFTKRLLTMELIFNEVTKNDEKPIIIQELGGFLSVITSFFVARKNGLDHYFIEPSFYKGRCFFLKNSFGPQKVNWSEDEKSLKAAADYLGQLSQSRSLIIPDKDKFHYKGVLQKVFRPYNFKRLAQKLWDKYVLKLQEEFSYPLTHVRKHINAIFNKWVMSSRYEKLPTQKFVYFPLHVPADMALTIRAPEYFDQCYTIEQIAKTVPVDTPVYIKEHPAMGGCHSSL